MRSTFHAGHEGPIPFARSNPKPQVTSQVTERRDHQGWLADPRATYVPHGRPVRRGRLSVIHLGDGTGGKTVSFFSHRRSRWWIRSRCRAPARPARFSRSGRPLRWQAVRGQGQRPRPRRPGRGWKATQARPGIGCHTRGG